MGAIIPYKRSLPVQIEEQRVYVLLGEGKLRAYRIKLQTIKNVDGARGIRKQTIEEGQIVAEHLFLAEAKLGELLKQIPKKYESSGRGRIEKRKSLPRGISYKMSHEAQLIASYPNAREEVLKQAKEKDDIPTKTDLFRIIKQQKREDRKENVRKQFQPSLQDGIDFLAKKAAKDLMELNENLKAGKFEDSEELSLLKECIEETLRLLK